MVLCIVNIVFEGLFYDIGKIYDLVVIYIVKYRFGMLV